MLNQMKSDGKLSDEAFVECLEKFHVFHDVEIQKKKISTIIYKIFDFS